MMGKFSVKARSLFHSLQSKTNTLKLAKQVSKNDQSHALREENSEEKAPSHVPPDFLSTHPSTRGREHPSRTARTSALGKRRRDEMVQNAIAIHEDEDVLQDPVQHAKIMNGRVTVTQEGVEQMQYSDEEEEEEQSEEEIDETVAEDMRKLEESFRGISSKYKLINRIGEGTFSTVYKAEQLPQPSEQDTENEDPDISSEGPAAKRRKTKHDLREPRFVALKKIYVTSSPHRIYNELELLHELRDSKYICPLLTAFRHLDQVVAVLPYFRHLDFRLYYRDFLVNDMRHYFRNLLQGLVHVHKAGILHRDIKPTNFLYNHANKHGVLVDFGLAERQGTDWQPCLCQEQKEKRREKFLNSYAVQALQNQSDLLSTTYPKSDNRPSRRANRAGTRGFRAPEVLLKCTAQTTKIDIWSTGVILLTLLAQRFPFFNSADDIDAMIEMASIFGRKKMQGVAAIHGSVFETNIETIGDKGFPFEKIILWATSREKTDTVLHCGEAQAVDLVSGLLELDPARRLSAKEALQHEFFTEPVEDEQERREREEQEEVEAIQEEMRLKEAAKLRVRLHQT